MGSAVDEVKEALLAYRFSSEEVEDDFLQERLPTLVDRVCVSGWGNGCGRCCVVGGVMAV